ncbi:ABC transporter ATP-binding protein [Bacillus sp. FJAT-29814]|uniref:ABC transporter ATP-binding protein n=1 Tax=Bacillus sp. FJAT-29814 TaxID=1729688 RepID=UPI000832BBA1|nr:ABC transporter ATP-binding protein [Bacillus sp. FJAT-29814]
MEPILQVENLSISFGGLKAIDDLSFMVEKGSIYGLIGPNGAGKTTVFNCISRFYTPDQGKLTFQGNVNLLHYKVHQMVDIGLVRTFQNVELFKNLTVLENLIIGQHSMTKGGFFAQGLRLPSVKREEKRIRDKALEIMDFLGIRGIEHLPGAAQPYGVMKLIELGRALMSDPKMIILDEPAAGMNHSETQTLTELIKKIRDKFGVTILLVEHDMNLVMEVCEKICVINFGKKIAEGTPNEIQNHPAVQEAYLGKEDEVHA